MATITNQATLSYVGGVTNSNITTGELLEAVSASLLSVSGTYAPDRELTFVLSIVNDGAAVTDGTVTVDLGGYEYEGETLYPLAYVEDSLLYLINGEEAAAAPTVEAGPPMVISGLDIPAESNITLIFAARVTAYAPLGEGAEITVTAIIGGGCISAPVTVTATVTAEDTPILTIAKSMCPEVITGCEEVTYTFVIQNTGSAAADAEANAVITDTFSPVLNNISVSFNGEAWTSPADYSYDETTGEFVTQVGALTIPAATYVQNEDGSYSTTPGVSILTVTGNLGAPSTPPVEPEPPVDPPAEGQKQKRK